MKFTATIKMIWPFSILFKPKKVKFEILPALTPGEKALQQELRRQALKEKMAELDEKFNDPSGGYWQNTSRSIRG